MRKLCCSYPELLDQVHIGSLILLHAALRDTRHVGCQRAVDQHTQHVQHCCEELTFGERTNKSQVDQETDKYTGKNLC